MERDRVHQREQEPTAYSQAARFRGEDPASRAYQQAQDLVYREDVELSAFRFHIQAIWHVAVVGEEPPADLRQQIEQLLAVGEPTILPRDVLALLLDRRNQETARGPWVERHYRPGRRFRLPGREGGDA